MPRLGTQPSVSPAILGDGRALVIDAKALRVPGRGQQRSDLLGAGRLAQHGDGRATPGQPGRPHVGVERDPQCRRRLRNGRQSLRLVQAILGGSSQGAGVAGRARRDEHPDPAEIEHGVGPCDRIGERGPRLLRRRGRGVGHPHHDGRVERERHTGDVTPGGDDDAAEQRGRGVVDVTFQICSHVEDRPAEVSVVQRLAS